MSVESTGIPEGRRGQLQLGWYAVCDPLVILVLFCLKQGEYCPIHPEPFTPLSNYRQKNFDASDSLALFQESSLLLEARGGQAHDPDLALGIEVALRLLNATRLCLVTSSVPRQVCRLACPPHDV